MDFSKDMRLLGNPQSLTVVENNANGREFYIAPSVVLQKALSTTGVYYGLKLLLIIINKKSC